MDTCYGVIGNRVRIRVSSGEVKKFKDSWPCSHLPECSIWFEFDANNGDLLDVIAGATSLAHADEEAVSALADDAKRWGIAEKLITKI